MRRWVLGTFAGWTAGFLLAILFIIVVDSLGILQTQSPLALGMGVGVGMAQARLLASVVRRLVVAVAQWALLSRFSDDAALWLVASPVGWMLASATVIASDGWIRRIPGIPGIVTALIYVAIILGGGLLLGLCTAPAARRLSIR